MRIIRGTEKKKSHLLVPFEFLLRIFEPEEDSADDVLTATDVP